MDHLDKDKASMSFVEQVVKRLNKLEDKIRRGRKGSDVSSDDDDGSRASGSSEADEDESNDDESRSRRRKSKKDKILKGDPTKPKLDQIKEEEEEEKVEVKSRHSQRSAKKGSLDKPPSQRMSARGSSHALPGAGGGTVSKEFE